MKRVKIICAFVHSNIAAALLVVNKDNPVINGKCSNAQACDDGSECDGVYENGACICHSYHDCQYYCVFDWGNKNPGTCSN